MIRKQADLAEILALGVVHGGATDVSTEGDNRLFRISQKAQAPLSHVQGIFRRLCLNFPINRTRDGPPLRVHLSLIA